MLAGVLDTFLLTPSKLFLYFNFSFKISKDCEYVLGEDTKIYKPCQMTRVWWANCSITVDRKFYDPNTNQLSIESPEIINKKHINFSVCLSIFRICFKLLSDDKIYVHDLVVYFLYLSQYIFHLHFRTSNTCLNGYTDKYLRRKKLVSQKQSLGSLLKPIKCHRLYERNFWFLKNNKNQLKD